MSITLNNPMGGITYPFLDEYAQGGYTLHYTPNKAGGSGPGIGCEGWAVDPVNGWKPPEPEIFCFYGAWYSHEDPYYYPQFSSFINGTDGLGGLHYNSYHSQDFLPAGPPVVDVSGTINAQSSLSAAAGVLRLAGGTVNAGSAFSAAAGAIRTVGAVIQAQSSLSAYVELAFCLTVTIVGTESPSEDFDHYNIYRSYEGKIDLSGAPYATAASFPWSEVLTSSGDYLYLFRAVDADGLEEANVSAMVRVLIVGGVAVTAIPAEPRAVTAQATAGATITVRWLYNPRKEEGGPGAAHEARVYWDAGTGTVDFGTPLATVALNHPKTADWWSWQSDALEDGTTYKFVVRIATDASLSGYETQNVDEHAATASDSAPTPPTLSAAIA